MNKKNGKNIKFRVVLFADVLKENLDGVTHTIYNIIQRIPKKEFEFIFITPYPPSEHVKLPFPVIVCRYIKMPLYKDYPLAFPYFDKKIAKVLKEFQPDLIHFTTPSFLGRFALKYGIKHNIPVVSTYHTHFPAYADYYFKHIPIISFLFTRLSHYVVKWYYNKCNCTFVPTKPIKDDLMSYGIEEKRLEIWGRGINTEQYNPSHRDETYMDKLCGKGTIRLLFVSRLYWIKEIKSLVGIYRILEKKYPAITMVITGDGPQRTYMEKRMPGAVFTGKLLGKDLARIYASSDIFVFPSITETFGNVNLEAMASGLPVVAAAKGGPMGIVQDGVTGYHAVPKNPEDFVKKIGKLVDDPRLLKQMKKNALQYARRQKWETLCDDLFTTYKKIIMTHSIELKEKNGAAV